MTWARLDDGFADHPKIVGLSDRAFRLHVTAICYAARHETNGKVPYSTAFVQVARKAMKELMDAGLWDRDETGIVIHDWLKYNYSREENDERRRQSHDEKVRAGRAGGLAKASRRLAAASTEPSRNGVAETLAKHSPVPTRPDPDPLPPPVVVDVAREAPSDDNPGLTRCTVAYDGLMGNAATTRTTLGVMAEWLESMQTTAYDGPAWFESACQEAAVNDGRSLKYVMAILRRWQKDGFQADTRGKNGSGEAGGTAAFVSAFARDIEEK